MRGCRFLAVVVSWVFIAEAAFGLGLGDIELNSALNQPLDADIKLVSVKPGEANQIRVTLADNIAFVTAGVERAPLLLGLQFSVRQKPDGSTFIKVTSKDPIREPFLDFIIEVNWPSGRLLREYTLLLDPPVFTDRAPTPAVDRVAANNDPFQAVPPKPAAPPRRAQPPRPAAAPPPSPPPQRAERARQAAQEYGPTAPPDTLWDIAQKMRTDRKIGIEQMMIALFRANPEAFFDNNINNLKSNVILKAPDPEEVARISQTEAAREARRHYNRWIQSRRRQKAVGETEVGSEAGLAARNSGVNGSPDLGESAESQPRLVLESPDDRLNPNARGTSEEIEELTQERDNALAQAEELRVTNEEQTKQIAELSKQIASMDRLIKLQSNQLVLLQNKLADAGIEVDELEVVGEEETGIKIGSPDEGPVGGNAKVEKPKEQTVADLILNRAVLGFIITAGILIASIAWLVLRRRRNEAEEEQLFMHATQDLNLPSAGENFVINDGAADNAGPPQGGLNAAATAAAPYSGDNFGNDFAGAGLEAIEAEEGDIDPIAEADVYLAYRRFDQAEELIRDALTQDPGNEELQLKLLEIYYGAGNKQAFEAQAEALYALVGGGQSPLWGKVVEMGREISPEHALFSAEGGAGGAEQQAFFDGESLGDQFDVSSADGIGEGFGGADGLQEFEQAGGAPGEQSLDGGESLAGALALDKDDFFGERGGSERSPQEDAVLESSPGADGQFSLSEASQSADNTLDFEQFGQDEATSNVLKGPGFVEEGQAQEKNATADGGSDPFDFDLSAFDQNNLDEDLANLESLTQQFESQIEQNTLETTTADAGGAAADGGFSGLGGDSSTEGGGKGQDLFDGEQGTGLAEEGAELFDNSDMVGTKLDLARAYIDMDDHDGARGILTEVMQEGNPQQKQQAQDLMQKIG